MEAWREKRRRLRRLMRGHEGAATTLLVVMFAGAVAETFGLSLVLPLLSAVTGFGAGDGGLVVESAARLIELLPAAWVIESLLGLLALAFLLKGLLLVASRGLSERFAMNLRADWAERLLGHYLTARRSYLATTKHGVVVNNIVSETYRASRGVVIILDFLNRIILALALFAVLMAADWQVTLALAGAGAVFFIAIRRSMHRFTGKLGKRRVRLYQAISEVATESVGATLQIKLFGTYDRVAARLRDYLDRHTRNYTLFRIVSELPQQSTEFIIIAILAVGVVALRYFGDVAPKDLLAMLGFYIVLGQRLLTTINYIVARRMKIGVTGASLVLVDDLLSNAPSREDLTGGEDFPGLQGDIVFEGVAFAHAGRGRAVFKNLNLVARKGQTTAIVGPSGVGKSTLADLLLGLERPSAGRITLGARDLAGFNLASLRGAIGYVSQEPQLFNVTIRENIRLGRPDADDAMVEAAARRAHAHDFVTALPNGYDEVTGDRGVQLSGGQRQRIAIARVLLRNPDIYIFDEATSALDTASEQSIREAIAELAGEATVIVIAHRLSTVENADAIYELDGMGGARQTSFADLAV